MNFGKDALEAIQHHRQDNRPDGKQNRRRDRTEKLGFFVKQGTLTGNKRNSGLPGACRGISRTQTSWAIYDRGGALEAWRPPPKQAQTDVSTIALG